MDSKDYAAYLETLPKKRMASAALFRDEKSRVLLVKPSYKTGWNQPGGVVEEDESPKAACIREVREELGLDLPIGRMLLVDYNNQWKDHTEMLMFIFDGGVLDLDTINAVQLQEEELVGFAFYKISELPEDMHERPRRRLIRTYNQLGSNGGIYLEDQERV
jgi:8-oxo-dGTP diphosphatase